MPLYHIRRAAEQDIAGVMALYAVLRPHDPVLPHEQLRALWHDAGGGPHSMIVVAECNCVIASTCMLATVANLASGGRRIGLIEHVVTAPAFRGQGLGRDVLEFALAQAWAMGCCKVVLLSGSQRTDAHRLYRSVGFDGDAEMGFVAKPP